MENNQRVGYNSGNDVVRGCCSYAAMQVKIPTVNAAATRSQYCPKVQITETSMADILYMQNSVDNRQQKNASVTWLVVLLQEYSSQAITAATSKKHLATFDTS